MKNLLPLLTLTIATFLVFISAPACAQGVLILDGPDGSVLPIVRSETNLDVTDQVATISSTQTFFNSFSVDTVAEYAFSLPEQAAALRILYEVNGTQYESVFSGTAQDTLLLGEDTTNVSNPSDPTHASLSEFLGETPVHFQFEIPITAGSYCKFTMEYVELLGYNFNHVYYSDISDYSLLGITELDTFGYSATIQSQRAITHISLLDNATTNPTVEQFGIVTNPNNANVSIERINYDIATRISLDYELENSNFGLIDFSTLLPDSAAKCDTLGNGFFGLILEPEGEQSEIVNKDFVLIIDKSGSMNGGKIADAKEAAHYVLDHLNPNDRFNIVVFNSSSGSFQTGLIPFSASNVSSGHVFVDNISSGGGTNISSSFDLAIPMFSSSPASHAKVVVFLTDGQANGGITNTSSLVSHVNALVNGQGMSYDFSLFCFGVDGANEQLLNQLANQNNGQAFYINSAQLSAVMTQFYNSIQNPVVLNTQLSFDPPIVNNIYPQNLPNFYLGQQLVVFGRFDTTGTTAVTLSGINNGSPVSYTYQLNLADTVQPNYSFLPKMWVKKYIDHQVGEYYNQTNLNGPEAQAIQGDVITASLCNGVLSPFTSFQGDPTGGGWGSVEIEEIADKDEFKNVYPNPFHEEITFDLSAFSGKEVNILIYDAMGNLVAELHSFNTDSFVWDGRTSNGSLTLPGIYFFQLVADTQILHGRIEKI